MNQDPYEENSDELISEEVSTDEKLIEQDSPEVNKKETRKPFKKKGISKTKYNLLFYGSIGITFIVIAIIVVDLVIGLNVARALFTWDWTINKKVEKTEDDKKKPEAKITKVSDYDTAMNYAKFTIEQYDKVVMLRGESKIADLPKEGGVIADVRKRYTRVITNYYQTMKLWYNFNCTKIVSDGWEKGDLGHKTDDELTKAVAKVEEIIAELKRDDELDYIFADRSMRNQEDEIYDLQQNYLDIVKRLGPKTPADILEDMAEGIDDAESKRVEILGNLRSLLTDISDLKESTTEYTDKLNEIESEANDFFLQCWTTLIEYYKYMMYAKDNELEPSSIVMKTGTKIEETTFDYIETRLKDIGSSIDRNTPFAEEARIQAEKLKEDVNNYGKEEIEDKGVEEDKGYVDEATDDDKEENEDENSDDDENEDNEKENNDTKEETNEDENDNANNE